MATHPTNLSPPDDETLALTDLLRRINSPADNVSLSRLDKIRINYGLRLLRLEMAGQPHDTITDHTTEQNDERGRR